MAEQAELKPVDKMNKTELRAELEQHGETPSGSVTNKQLRERLLQIRYEGIAESDDQPLEGEVVAEEEVPVEPTPEEAAQEHTSDSGQAAQLVEAESMALELRERGMAIGPQQTIPALAELNAISVIAERLASSGIVPVPYRGKPDDVVAAILMGRELGIGPMQSLKDIAVIDGKPALAAHLQLAVLRRAGVQIIESYVDDNRAIITARRPDGEVGTVEWTYEEASKVKVGNSGKTLIDKDNWKNYRQDMLWARTVGRWTRRFGSDLVAGMPYTAEEVRDFEDDAYGYGSGAKPIYRQDAQGPKTPASRAELLQRFAQIFGDGNADDCKATAATFVKEALQAGWKVDTFGELGGSAGSNEAFQKIASAIMLLEDETPDLSLATGVRQTVAKAFAQRMDGIMLVGPPWRLGPDEMNFPTWQEQLSAELASDRDTSSAATEASDSGNASGSEADTIDAGDEPLIKPGEGDEDIAFGDQHDGYPGA